MKKLLFLLSLFLITSCASFQISEPVRVSVRTQGFDSQYYAFNTYDYNSIHYMWVNNPYYFYNYGYYVNGIYTPYYLHPYFVRYCTYRNIRPNHNYYRTRVNSRRNTTVRNNRTVQSRRATTTTRRNTVQPRRTTTTTRRNTVQPRRTTTSRNHRQISTVKNKRKMQVPRRN